MISRQKPFFAIAWMLGWAGSLFLLALLLARQWAASKLGMPPPPASAQHTFSLRFSANWIGYPSLYWCLCLAGRYLCRRCRRRHRRREASRDAPGVPKERKSVRVSPIFLNFRVPKQKNGEFPILFRLCFSSGHCDVPRRTEQGKKKKFCPLPFPILDPDAGLR